MAKHMFEIMLHGTNTTLPLTLQSKVYNNYHDSPSVQHSQSTPQEIERTYIQPHELHRTARPHHYMQHLTYMFSYRGGDRNSESTTSNCRVDFDVGQARCSSP
jgi:hypothetical protein